MILNNAEIDVLLLVGGQGTRLRPVLPDVPKPLAHVGGRPFVSYILKQLADNGFRRVILCTGYQAQKVQNVLGNYFSTLTLSYSREKIPLGTAGALRRALPLLRSPLALVMNGDSYCRLNLHEFMAWHQQQGLEASLVACEVMESERFGQLSLSEGGHLVHSFHEKSELELPGWVNAGIYAMTRHLLAEIPSQGSVSLERDILPNWAARGLLGAFKSQADFWDIGTPRSYAEAGAYMHALESHAVLGM